MSVIRVRDPRSRVWCYLSAEALAQSALEAKVTIDDLMATIKSFCMTSPSLSKHKRAFEKKALEYFNNGTASCDNINKNKQPKEGN